MTDIDVLLEEWQADWALQGGAAITIRTYRGYVSALVGSADPDSVTLPQVKTWLAGSPSSTTARHRGCAVRAFAKWALANEGPQWSWWPQVPLALVRPVPQPTADDAAYRAALSGCGSWRDRCVIELLWSTGMRVSELERVLVEHVDLAGGFVVIPTTKTGKPRVAPLSDGARRAVRRQIGARTSGPLLGMSAHAVQLLLRRLGAPSPHSWRRGWAVKALRDGVSEASVRAAAGWSSGAMVARYTSAVSAELAIAEFTRVRAS